MSERVNWRKIADQLAARLMHHQWCDNRHESIAEGVDEDCPFCLDAHAYEQYVIAGGTRRMDSLGNAVTVSLAALTSPPTTTKTRSHDEGVQGA